MTPAFLLRTSVTPILIVWAVEQSVSLSHTHSLTHSLTLALSGGLKMVQKELNGSLIIGIDAVEGLTTDGVLSAAEGGACDVRIDSTGTPYVCTLCAGVGTIVSTKSSSA